MDFMSNGRLTAPARLARAFVNKQFLTKIAGGTAGIHIIAQRRAARLDGGAEHLFNGCDERDDFPSFQFASGPSRANVCSEQRLTGVNVANAYNDTGIHDA